MIKLLIAALIIINLSACGGETTFQDKSSANGSTPTKQSTVVQATVEKNKQDAETAKETTKNSHSETKTDTAIRIAIGVARSMF